MFHIGTSVAVLVWLQIEISALHHDILISTAGAVCGLPGGTSLLDQLQGYFTGNTTVEVWYLVACYQKCLIGLSLSVFLYITYEHYSLLICHFSM